MIVKNVTKVPLYLSKSCYNIGIFLKESLMKKFLFFAIFIAYTTSSLYANSKRYDIASGVVSYQTSTSGTLLGFGTNSKGSKTLYFKEYGNIEVQESRSSSSSMKESEESHSLTKFENGMVYVVDFRKKVIIKKDMRSLMEDKNMHAMGKDMLKKMGGKKIGSGKVLGYTCEIWEAMGSKMWLYKGVLLKLESNILGIHTTEIATKANFNTSIPDAKFSLPNYPIQTLNEMIQEQLQHSQPSSQPTPNIPAGEKIPKMEDIQKLLKGVGGMFGGE
jgi:hypothetical protein